VAYGAAAFAPGGYLLATSSDGTLRQWPLSPAAGVGSRELWSRPGALIEGSLEITTGGRCAVVMERFAGTVFVVPLDGSEVSVHALKRSPGETLWSGPVALDPAARFAAIPVAHPGNPDANELRILDLATGEERHLDTQPPGEERCEEPGSLNQGLAVPVWLRDGRLISDGDAGLRMWDPASGGSRLLRECGEADPSAGILLLATPDSRSVLRLKPAVRVGAASSLSAFDLATGATREITSHGNKLMSFAVDASGTILVTGSTDGVVRVGPLSGEEPHLHHGHSATVISVAVSPDGRWIASGSDDGTLRLWPMPDLSRPPLHTLPHDELIAKLKSLTNLRAVRDPDSDTGWTIEVGPFPGWATVPEW
jgi:WD40 repeat protein